MRFTSLSIWLACSFASSARAFSTLSKNHHTVAAVSSSVVQNPHNNNLSRRQPQLRRQDNLFPLSVASADTISVADMERGVGGRIEAAFEAAKEKGEAAFVTFITAGYPSAQGRWNGGVNHREVLCFCVHFTQLTTHSSFDVLADLIFQRHTCPALGDARRRCFRH